MKSIRESIVDLLVKMEQDETYMQLLLKKELMAFEVKDRAFMTEVLYGTMKYRLRLDHIINQFSKTPVKKMKPLIRNSLRMTVYQLLFLDKIPASAAINEAVKIINRRKMNNLSGFVNGVLRSIDRGRDQITYPSKENDFEAYLSVFYSVPEWMIKMWLQSYGKDVTEKICISLGQKAEVCIRINTLCSSLEEVTALLTQEGMRVESGKLLPKENLMLRGTGPIAESESFKKGLWTVQDESAMLVGHIVDPQPGECILDMCSAPGGKSTHMAQLMGNQGQIISTDIHDHKIEIIEKNASRLGITCIDAVCQDGTAFKAEWKEKFDRILLDAPCSGLGIIKRKPDIRYSKEAADLDAIFEIQKKLAAVAKGYLKPDGVLVYSTCTISPQENEQMVTYIEKKLGLTLEAMGDRLPESLRPYEDRGVQILPFVADSDGFFIARFRKRG
ncbi:MAG: 16S rRNA (cytosine(967)-C(5))-methyltransferase RsmB [Cellulosilyticaceae bacterium]